MQYVDDIAFATVARPQAYPQTFSTLVLQLLASLLYTRAQTD